MAVVLALFVAVVWFAYQDLMPGRERGAALIRADAAPIKREPLERGGLPLVNSESAVVQALDEPDSPVRVERIVPRATDVPRSTADIIPDVLEAEPGSATAAIDAAGVDMGGVDVAGVDAAGIDTGGVDPATGSALDTWWRRLPRGHGSCARSSPRRGRPWPISRPHRRPPPGSPCPRRSPRASPARL